MKTLESVLMIKNEATGESFSLSSTCAEINEEMPNHLGVSKPILENVIFCHQEESFWPLSEPLVLKKKFDEIFAATRYTKALDSIKSIRKKTLVEMKANKVELDNLKQNKARAAKFQKDLHKMASEINVMSARIAEIDSGELEQVNAKITDLMDQSTELNRIKNRIDQFTLERDMVMKNAETLAQNTTLLYDSDADLQNKLNQFNQSISKQSSDQDKLERRKAEIAQQQSGLQLQISNQLALQGRLEAEHNAHLARIDERQNIAKELLRKHSFSGFSAANLSNIEVNRFIEKLNEEITSKSSQLKREKENEYHGELRQLHSALSGLEENKRSTRQQIESLTEKIASTNASIHALSDSVEDLDQINEVIVRAESKVSRAKQALQELETDSEVLHLGSNLQNLERQAQKIRDEMSVLNLQGDTRARLSLKKTDKVRKTEAYNKITAMLKVECEALLKKPFRHDSLEQDLEALVSTQLDGLRVSKERLAAKTAEMSGLDAKLSMLRTELEEKNNEVTLKTEKLRAVCGNDSFEDYKLHAEREVENHRGTVSSMSSASSMYTKFIEKFQASHCCPLCVRGFSNESEKQAFRTKLETILARVPLASANANSDLAKWTGILSSLRELQSTSDDCQRLTNVEIPELRTKRDHLGRERSALYAVIEDVESEIGILDAELQNMNHLKSRAHEAAQITKEIQQIDRDIAALSADLSSSGSSKTMDEAQQDYDSIQTQCKSIRTRIDRANHELKLKTQELAALEMQVREIKDKKQKIEYQVKERSQLKQTVHELQSEHLRLSRQQEETDSRAADLPLQIESIQAKLSGFQAQFAREEDTALKYIQGITSSLNRIMTVQREIERYLNDRKEAELQTCREQLSSLQTVSKTLVDDLDSVTSKIDFLSKEYSQIQLTQRNISDNLQLRKFKKDKVTLEGQIAGLQSDMEAFDTSSIHDQLVELRAVQDGLTLERAKISGSLSQLKENHDNISKILALDYKDVEKNYLEKKFRYTADELAMNDLEKYSKALEE
ncbi:DNA repair protein rad50 [Kappamyces sp. JEL0680]|nr:DNA repair protein rad50 [Kappamyces sp. JEL0680]